MEAAATAQAALALLEKPRVASAELPTGAYPHRTCCRMPFRSMEPRTYCRIWRQVEPRAGKELAVAPKLEPMAELAAPRVVAPVAAPGWRPGGCRCRTSHRRYRLPVRRICCRSLPWFPLIAGTSSFLNTAGWARRPPDSRPETGATNPSSDSKAAAPPNAAVSNRFDEVVLHQSFRCFLPHGSTLYSADIPDTMWSSSSMSRIPLGERDSHLDSRRDAGATNSPACARANVKQVTGGVNETAL
jgi:hypothetical protein